MKHLDFCRPHMDPKTDPLRVELTYFDLDTDVLALVRCITEEDRPTLQLYRNVWEYHERKTIDLPRRLSLEDVVREIWQPSEKDFEQNITRIERGTFTFQEIDTMLRKFTGLSKEHCVHLLMITIFFLAF